MNVQLRPQEIALFKGDATLLKSALSVQPTDVIVTDQRLVIAVSSQVIEKADIASAIEGKHGFTPKIVFTLRDGRSLALTAANAQGFKAAAFILTGQAEAGAMPAGPALSQVKNGTAWLAALGPLLGGLLSGVIALLFWGDPDNWGAGAVLSVLFMRITFLWLFLRIDHLMLQRQGYNVKQLGLADPIALPYYLFSRAKVFGHSKLYGITWCVLVALDILVVFA